MDRKSRTVSRAKSRLTPVNLHCPDSSQKQVYIKQLKTLLNELHNIQRTCDYYTVVNDEITFKLPHTLKDKEEICEYLKSTVDKRGDELANLKLHYEEIQQQRDKESDEHLTTLVELQRDIENKSRALESEKMISSGKIAALEDLKIQRLELNDKFIKIREEINQTKLSNENIIYDTERYNLLENDRLFKEMIKRVDYLVGQFCSAAVRTMNETNETALNANIFLTNNVKILSFHVMKLIKENQFLLAIKKKRSVEIEALSDTEVISRQKHRNKMMAFRKLLKKCEQLFKVDEILRKEGTLEDIQLLKSQLDEENLRCTADKAKLHFLKENYCQIVFDTSQECQKLNSYRSAWKSSQIFVADSIITLRNARDMFSPEFQKTKASSKFLNFTEKSERKQLMLNVIFILLDILNTHVKRISPIKLKRSDLIEIKNFQYNDDIQHQLSTFSVRRDSINMCIELAEKHGISVSLPERPHSSRIPGFLRSELQIETKNLIDTTKKYKSVGIMVNPQAEKDLPENNDRKPGQLRCRYRNNILKMKENSVPQPHLSSEKILERLPSAHRILHEKGKLSSKKSRRKYYSESKVLKKVPSILRY